MKKVELTLATWDYDRVRPLMDGRVKVEGCEIIYVNATPEEFSHRVPFQDFDVTEIGLLPYINETSRGTGLGGINGYVAIPVFPSRMFRCSAIYIRTDRGIEKPEDLKGKKVGVPTYSMTAAFWTRGFLQDEYGIRAEDIHWMQGGMDNPGRKDIIQLNLPKNFPLYPLTGDQTINKLLASGDLDAYIGARTPSCYRDGKTPVRRLFENFEAVEKAYYKRTKIFPIMHALGLRRELYNKYPWLALNLYLAFCEAKRISQAELFETGALKIGLPWVVSEALETQEIMGRDIFPYGVESSRPTIEAAIRYSTQQYLADRPVCIEELFPPNTLTEPKR